MSGGVGELIVFCCSHAAQIKAYLDSSKWSRRKGLLLRVVVDTSCYSFGDAMRHLDTLDLIKRDFVLLSGDVVSNLRLEPIVKAHKARVAQDKQNMMTLICKQASHAHRTRPLADDAVFAIDPATQQLLLYENDRTSGRVSLDATLLTETKSSLQLRYDLMDSNISICTPEVLMLFTDNFDWQTFHGDFLAGVLGNEILGNKLFVHTVSRDEYAARCDDLRTYASLSKDVIHRWTYPLVPDNNLLGDLSSTTFKYHRGNIYKEDHVQVSREAKVAEETAIGAGTTIGARTLVRQSVIGRDCTIGQDVSLTGSYVWSGVTIENGAVIDRAILADGVVVKAGARIGHGAILSFGVVIGAGHVVPPYTKITTARSDDEDDEEAEDDLEDDDEDTVANAESGDESSTAAPAKAAKASTPVAADGEWLESEVGVGGIGRIYRGKDFDDEEDEDEKEDGVDGARPSFRLSQFNSIAPDPVAVSAFLRSQFADESEDEWDDDAIADDDEDDDGDDANDPALANQLGGVGSAANQNFHKFAEEVSETLQRGHKEKLSVDDIGLELNGLKFSHNTNVEEFAHAVFLAIFELVDEAINPGKTGGAAGALPLDPTKSKPVMQALGSLLKAWYKVVGKFGKLVSDQVYMLQGLEQACLASGFIGTLANPASLLDANATSIYTPLFTPTLQLMYENFPVFTEDAIFQWATSLEESASATHPLLGQSAAFRNWLEEADEEEDEEDDEDEE